MPKSVSHRFCRQCGDPLPKDANPHTYLCGACSKHNATLKNRQNNKAWYAKNKEKRKAAYRLAHPKKTKVISEEKPIQFPPADEIRANVDRLLKQAEEHERWFGRRSCEPRPYDLVDSPFGPVCANPVQVKRSRASEDPAPRSYHTAMVDGREVVIETRGRICGGCHTTSNTPFRS